MGKDRVIIIYGWFKSAMSVAGRKISFPADTDPKKTYQYRWVNTFVSYVDSVGLSDKMIKKLIACIIQYAKEKKILDKGTSLLRTKSVIKASIDRLHRMSKSENQMFVDLSQSKNFVDSESMNTDPIKVMVSKQRIGSFTNLVKWYQSGKVNTEYIALSRSCNKALQLLPPDERDELPDNVELLKRRTRLLIDPTDRQKIESIIGSDLATSE